MSESTATAVPRWRASARVKTRDQTRLETSAEGEMDPVKFDEGAEVGQVGLTIGRTINLGDYESAKVDVYVCLPFDATKANAAGEAYDQVLGFCRDKLYTMVERIEGKTKK